MMNTKLKGTIFFVGSGISHDAPSGLPLGNELTRAIIDWSCGQDIEEAIINTWQAASEQISLFNPNLQFQMPRLETICGCIYEMDKIMNRKSILNGFLSFSKIPYNCNHYILSEFLRNGADILTTNFDLGIENAYAKKYNDFTNALLYETSVFKTNRGGMIYHLHGSANDDIERLGVTISRVKNGLSNGIREHLIEKINSSKRLIFLGYGVVDSFDITPLLESKKIAGKNMVFIKHQAIGESDCSNKSELPYNLSRITKNFLHIEVFMKHTTTFLKDFAKSNFINIDDKEKSKSDFKWKREFLCAMGNEYSDDEKLLNYLGIRYQLGFNPRIVEKSRPKIISDIKRLKSKILTTNPRIIDYFNTALRDFDTPIDKRFALPTTRVNQAVDFIDKSHIIALRDECDYLLNKYRNIETDIEETDKRRIDFLLDLLCMYSELDYDKVQYISYIITCLKYKALFLVRFRKENPLDTNYKELLLSLDISHFEGVVTALLHSIESTIILNRRTVVDKIAEGSNEIQLNHLMHITKEIANIIGCNYYKVIIDGF